MTEKRVDYDQVAPTYNQRFAADRISGIAQALTDFTCQHQLTSILEVGCGTGHWLAGLASSGLLCYGLDLSQGMLRQAQERVEPLRLAQGKAGRLPFPAGEFELVFCVNAIHHFDDPSSFIYEVHRILRPEGWLAVIGSDPHGKPDRWYGYGYFPSSYQTDLDRFPGERRLSQWFAAAGYSCFNRQRLERISKTLAGREVLTDPFLRKQAISQLALLSEAEYASGLARIEEDVERAEQQGDRIEFRSEINVLMWYGRKI